MKKGIERTKRPLPLKQMGYLAGAAAALFLGFLMAVAWGDNKANMLLAMGVIVLWPGGGFLLYRGLKRQGQEVVIVGSEKPTSPVNSLNIYGRKDPITGTIYAEKVAFEWINNPEGQPQQCLNNGQWYYIHAFNLDKQKLGYFVLPDSQYFDPREFANVIVMPNHRKLFEQQISLLQKVAPWVMLLAFGVSLFGMIATAPTP